MNNTKNKPLSLLHSILSFILPGLGQTIAGYWQRGLTVLFTTLILGSLSIWTVAQKARFPEYDTTLDVYMILFAQAMALLIFILALRYLALRFIFKAKESASMSWSISGLAYFAAILFAKDNILASAGSEETLKLIFTATALFSAAALAAFWIWQTLDAGKTGNKPEKMPSMTNGILIASLLVLSLGANTVNADIAKAIAEYRDTTKILSRIAWPWRNAFEYETVDTETTQKIQAPCPPGATGPESNAPVSGETWVSVDLTCVELTTRDMAGTMTYGPDLTITGGGYIPGATVELLWKNPIGNAFTPRGVGETDIEIDENGEFTTILIVPEIAIPSTAVGDQIHTLLIREKSVEVFTGKMSREMKLALQGMLETIMIALMATVFGIILAFPVSFLAARNLMSAMISPFNRVIGNAAGFILGIIASSIISQKIGAELGGLEENPIPIFLISVFLLILLAIIGNQIVGNLYARLTLSLGGIVTRALNGAVLAALFAAPGYALGLFTNHKIATISLGDAALGDETLYAYIGLGIAVSIGLIMGLIFKPYRETGIGMLIYFVIRTTMNIIRSIEPIIWAIVGTIWVGLGPFAGTIALTLHTIAALGKLYSESIESIDAGPIEALQATGATRLQTIIYAVIPQIMPPFISFTIYRWDINVRMSTILGLVGGGGIGFILIQWIRQYQYTSAGLAVWLITITVSLMDYVSSRIRAKFV